MLCNRLHQRVVFLIHGNITERYLVLRVDTEPKLTRASPARTAPNITFSSVFLKSSGLTQVFSHLATMMKTVPPIMASPSALVTTPTPVSGKIALPKMSPAVKN